MKYSTCWILTSDFSTAVVYYYNVTFLTKIIAKCGLHESKRISRGIEV